MSWYLAEWASLVEMTIVRREAQQELSDIGDVGGPGWHWDPGGTSYHISGMQEGYRIVNSVIE